MAIRTLFKSLKPFSLSFLLDKKSIDRVFFLFFIYLISKRSNNGSYFLSVDLVEVHHEEM